MPYVKSSAVTIYETATYVILSNSTRYHQGTRFNSRLRSTYSSHSQMAMFPLRCVQEEEVICEPDGEYMTIALHGEEIIQYHCASRYDKVKYNMQ